MPLATLAGLLRPVRHHLVDVEHVEIENPSHMLAWTFRYPSRVTIGPPALLAFVDEFCADVLDFDIRDSAAAAGEHGLPTMRVIGRAGKGKRRFLVLGLDVKNLFDCETERDLAFDGEVLQDF